MFKKYSEKNAGGLTLKHKIGYGLGDAGGCMTFAIMGSTFAMYCTDALKIDTVLLGILLAVWNIWDFINDPIMGALLDKSFAKNHNPKGKFRPWLLRSAPLVCVSFIALWSVPSFFEGVSLPRRRCQRGRLFEGGGERRGGADLPLHSAARGSTGR